MSLKFTVSAALAACMAAAPALAEITVDDAYARAAGKMAKAGAAFMMIHNSGDADDRLIAAASDVSKKVELHTHIEGDGGVMKMVEVEEGFAIPAGGMHALKRGGDHVMFMGLNGPWEHGDIVTVTLTFEQAGDITLEIPVDLERKPGMGMGSGHGQGNN
ncbi:MAG: copper chaperone PCu(A)C [Rhodobacteraceae bacterium]|nr:copper chaperone PCu(A)C [Paracoccaceae bacterium]